MAVVVAGPSEPEKADGIGPAALAAAESSGVRFLGHRSDVEDLYAAFDMYVLASYREGFPRSAMEAAAMGLPVVATDIRGCRQVVEHGSTGLLVPPRDAAALTDAWPGWPATPVSAPPWEARPSPRRSGISTSARSLRRRSPCMKNLLERKAPTRRGRQSRGQ